VLQHGSLPLTGDITRLIDCLALPSEEERDALRRALAERAATVEDITGRCVSLEEAATALTAGFSEALGLSFIPDELSEVERGWVDELVRDRYQDVEWPAQR
jgi:lipoate-protein ligase A